MIGERELWATIDRLRESMGEHHGTGLPAWEKWCEENGINWEDLRAAANAYLSSFKTWLEESCLAEAAADMWLHAFQIGYLVPRAEGIDLSDTSADLHIEGDPQFKRRVEEERRAEPEVEAQQLRRWREYRLLVNGNGSTPVRFLDQLEGIEQNYEESLEGAERQRRTVTRYRDGGEYRSPWEKMPPARCTCEPCPHPWRDPNCAVHARR